MSIYDKYKEEEMLRYVMMDEGLSKKVYDIERYEYRWVYSRYIWEGHPKLPDISPTPIH